MNLSVLITNKELRAYFIFLLMALAFTVIVTIPRAIYKFVEFPTLEEATVIEGIIKVHCYSTYSRRGAGESCRNYLVDNAGIRRRLTIGPYGDRTPVLTANIYSGIKAKVWLDPYYGLIQGEYEKPPEMIARFIKRFNIVRVKEPNSYSRNSITDDRFGDTYMSMKLGAKTRRMELEETSNYITYGLLICIYLLIKIVRTYKNNKIESPLSP